jgi:hypothetical protein
MIAAPKLNKRSGRRRTSMAHDLLYTMLIEWSDEDDAYIVSFPEWEEQQGLIGHTHG